MQISQKSILYLDTFKAWLGKDSKWFSELLTQVIPASLQELSLVPGPLGHLRGQFPVSVLNLDGCCCCLPCDHGGKWKLTYGNRLRSTHSLVSICHGVVCLSPGHICLSCDTRVW